MGVHSAGIVSDLPDTESLGERSVLVGVQHVAPQPPCKSVRPCSERLCTFARTGPRSLPHRVSAHSKLQCAGVQCL